MIHKIEAVVLRSMNYQESSKILTLYTREFGAIGVIVKGARRAKNKFGASLEPLAHINAVIYKKESRELQLLTDADLISSFSKTQQNFEKLFLSLSILEFTYLATRYTEQNDALFNLIIEVLEEIEFATKSPILLFYYFETRIIGMLGFQPSIDRCSSCGTTIEGLEKQGIRQVLFEIDRGAFQCEKCLPFIDSEMGVNLQAVKMWEQLNHLSVKNILDLSVDRDLQSGLDRIISRYIEHHQPEIRTLRAKQMFDSIRPDKNS